MLELDDALDHSDGLCMCAEVILPYECMSDDEVLVPAEVHTFRTEQDRNDDLVFCVQRGHCR